MLTIAVLICFFWMLSLCLHEFGHAITAYCGGDKSVKEKGYLTLNPLKYTDANVSLLMPLLILMIGGIALPGGAVYINHNQLRNRKWKSAVSLAGPLANAIISAVLAIPFMLGWHESALSNNENSFQLYAYSALAYSVTLNIFVVLINLMPIPGLDGFGIIEPWLPQTIKPKLAWLYQYGIWILMGLLWFVQGFSRTLWNITFALGGFLRVNRTLIFTGSEGFRGYSLLLVVGLIAILWIFRDKDKDLYRTGTQLISQGKYPEALEKFNTLLAKQPSNADALLMQGYCYYCQQQYENALKSYMQGLQYQPDSSRLYYYQGIVYKDLNDTTAAISAFDRAIELNQEDTGSWYEKAKILVAKQEWQTALAAVERVLQLKVQDGEVYSLKGDVLIALGRHDDAINAYNQAFKLQPNSLAWVKLVKLLEKLKKNDELLALYDQKIRLKPDNPDIWYRRGLSLAKMNLPQEAEESYDKAVACYEYLTKRRQRDAKMWCDYGKFLEKLQRYDAANVVYHRAVENWKRDFEGSKSPTANMWYEYGLILDKLNRNEEALVAYNRVTEIEPEFYQAWYLSAKLHELNERYNNAVLSYDRVLKICPDDSNTWWMRGNTLAKLEKYDDAVICYDRAIEIYPEFYGFWLARGTVLYALEQFQDAYAAYNTAIQKNPTSVRAWEYKGLALIKLGDLNGAIDAFDDAIKIDEDYSSAWYNKACAYALQQNQDLAADALRQAIKLGGEHYRELAKCDCDFDDLPGYSVK
ncbi:MAG: tetratricopeptide repeat protein [Scytonematopsis contorta HA4267-MV1]|jgi:tetratricopeptide (TPR) repeat protein|nr:tetratricopeptide repeat protein [Scytonematopsis contorta HA4267-MV1]